jgi:SRSO17 transposase
MEMSPSETAPCKSWLLTLPRRATREQLVDLVKEHCWTERVYEDLKGGLGLDHFEGRTYRGWHHHVTVALVCFAFIVAERARRAFPQRRPGEDARWGVGTTPFPSPPS